MPPGEHTELSAEVARLRELKREHADTLQNHELNIQLLKVGIANVNEHLARQDVSLRQTAIVVSGDGNGNLGLVRHLDAVKSDIREIKNIVGKSHSKIWNVVLCVLTAVLTALALKLIH